MWSLITPTFSKVIKSWLRSAGSNPRPGCGGALAPRPWTLIHPSKCWVVFPVPGCLLHCPIIGASLGLAISLVVSMPCLRPWGTGLWVPVLRVYYLRPISQGNLIRLLASHPPSLCLVQVNCGRLTTYPGSPGEGLWGTYGEKLKKELSVKYHLSLAWSWERVHS